MIWAHCRQLEGPYSIHVRTYWSSDTNCVLDLAHHWVYYCICLISSSPFHLILAELCWIRHLFRLQNSHQHCILDSLQHPDQDVHQYNVIYLPHIVFQLSPGHFRHLDSPAAVVKPSNWIGYLLLEMNWPHQHHLIVDTIKTVSIQLLHYITMCSSHMIILDCSGFLYSQPKLIRYTKSLILQYMAISSLLQELRLYLHCSFLVLWLRYLWVSHLWCFGQLGCFNLNSILLWMMQHLQFGVLYFHECLYSFLIARYASLSLLLIDSGCAKLPQASAERQSAGLHSNTHLEHRILHRQLLSLRQ